VCSEAAWSTLDHDPTFLGLEEAPLAGFSKLGDTGGPLTTFSFDAILSSAATTGQCDESSPRSPGDMEGESFIVMLKEVGCGPDGTLDDGDGGNSLAFNRKSDAFRTFKIVFSMDAAEEGGITSYFEEYHSLGFVMKSRWSGINEFLNRILSLRCLIACSASSRYPKWTNAANQVPCEGFLGRSISILSTS